jgi:hypothetical protein
VALLHFPFGTVVISIEGFAHGLIEGAGAIHAYKNVVDKESSNSLQSEIIVISPSGLCVSPLLCSLAACVQRRWPRHQLPNRLGSALEGVYPLLPMCWVSV